MYTFYTDTQHGWLKVKKSELVKLGIQNDISACSYMLKDHAYLEEDCDFAIFAKAKGMIVDGKLSPDFKYTEKHTNRSSRIRNYPRYQPQN